MSLAIGIDLGGTNLRAGGVPRRRRRDAAVGEPSRSRCGEDRAPGAIVERAAADRSSGSPATEPGPIAVGVGIAALLRDAAARSRIRRTCAGATCRSAAAARRGSARATRLGVYNDVNAITWGEAVAGAARGCRDVLAVYVGTGIGGGVIVGGRLVEGATQLRRRDRPHQGPVGRRGRAVPVRRPRLRRGVRRRQLPRRAGSARELSDKRPTHDGGRSSPAVDRARSRRATSTQAARTATRGRSGCGPSWRRCSRWRSPTRSRCSTRSGSCSAAACSARTPTLVALTEIALMLMAPPPMPRAALDRHGRARRRRRRAGRGAPGRGGRVRGRLSTRRGSRLRMLRPAADSAVGRCGIGS